MFRALVAALGLAALMAGTACQHADQRGDAGQSSQPQQFRDDLYRSEIDESPGAAVAILVDTSTSMRSRAPGDARPKAAVASQALEAMLDATEGALAGRPDFAVKIGLYSFSGSAVTILPIQPYDHGVVHEALQHLPRPDGDTAIGTAMRTALPDLYRSGLFRKYLLVVTDGENTRGPKPESVAREIHRRSEGGVQMYFVAFDTSAERFGFLRSIGGDVLGAGTGADLRRTLETIYEGRILAEADASGEQETAGR